MSEFRKFESKNRPSATAPQAGVAALPPAGHEQRETLKRRGDVLEEQAAASHANVEAIDPSAMEIEAELAKDFNMLEVSAKQPGFVYKWVNFVSNNGIMLRTATAPPERWQIVTGDMPEAIESKDASGCRKLGDVLLVRMPKIRYDILQRKREERTAAMTGIEATANNLRQIGGKKIPVHTIENASPQMVRAMTHPSPAAVAAMRGTEAAREQFDTALRTGEIDVRA